MEGKEIVEGIFGEIEFGDCRERIATIPDKQFDLCWLDPPFQVDYGESTFAKGGKSYDFPEGKIFYKDNWTDEEIIALMREIMPQMRRIAKCVLVHPGYVNEKRWWNDIAAPDFTLSRMLDNPKTGNDHARLRFRNPLFGYGEPPHAWRTDIFRTLVPWGFIPHPLLKHPCPMAADFMLSLLAEAQMQSVIDVMAGSGFIAEAAEALGIKYHGIELDQRYLPDIQFRISIGQKLRAIFQNQQQFFGAKERIIDYSPKAVKKAYAELRRYLSKNKLNKKRPRKVEIPPNQQQLNLG